MTEPYLVQCLDAVYDEENGFLVLNLFFTQLGEKRIIAWHKDDFLFKGKKGVPAIEMRRTGKMMKGKKFKMVIDDDPERKHLSEYQQVYYATLFNKKITEELTKVSDGLADDEGQMNRKLYRMGQEGKIDFAKMYNQEAAIRERLGLT